MSGLLVAASGGNNGAANAKVGGRALATRTTKVDSVEVSVAPREVSNGAAVFAITLDTHSGDLGVDLRKAATLTVGEMSIIAFLIALAVIALTLFTATLSKLREYAVVKALGASSWRLSGTVFAQATWSITLALIVAVILGLGVAVAATAVTANVRLAVEPGSIARVGLSALVAGALGALIPLRRVMRLDPATAFKG